MQPTHQRLWLVLVLAFSAIDLLIPNILQAQSRGNRPAGSVSSPARTPANSSPGGSNTPAKVQSNSAPSQPVNFNNPSGGSGNGGSFFKDLQSKVERPHALAIIGGLVAVFVIGFVVVGGLGKRPT
jgi:hypothetical protein